MWGDRLAEKSETQTPGWVPPAQSASGGGVSMRQGETEPAGDKATFFFLLLFLIQSTGFSFIATHPGLQQKEGSVTGVT